MELMHPHFLYIGLAVLVVALILSYILKRNNNYQGGIKVANTHLLYELDEFKKAKSKRKILSFFFQLSIVLAIISSLFLIARPYKKDSVSSGIKKRDIFLCLDVSYSLYDLNYAIVDQLKEVVLSMEGDRFGISIFNTSTILYVPLTDDYDFVIGKLEELEEYFSLQKEYMDKFGEYTYIPDGMYEEYTDYEMKLRAIDAGTLVNNYYKGSSLIGEGLASCLYSFPHLEDESRTRAIILSTDNSQLENNPPIVELDEAASLCKSHDVNIFGIFPDKDTYDKSYVYDYENNLSDFQQALFDADGIVYEQSKTLTVEDIVQDIEKHEALSVKEISTTKTIDQPTIPTAILLGSFLLFLLTGGLLVKD